MLGVKRNMELIRKMLFAAEAAEGGYAPGPLEIEGYSEAEIGYHAYLLCDAGLAFGIDVETRESEGPEYQLRHLTWAGHEFLDAARDEPRWRKAMAAIGSAGGSVTLSVLQSLLTSYAAQQLGIR